MEFTSARLEKLIAGSRRPADSEAAKANGFRNPHSNWGAAPGLTEVRTYQFEDGSGGRVAFSWSRGGATEFSITVQGKEAFRATIGRIVVSFAPVEELNLLTSSPEAAASARGLVADTLSRTRLIERLADRRRRIGRGDFHVPEGTMTPDVLVGLVPQEATVVFTPTTVPSSRMMELLGVYSEAGSATMHEMYEIPYLMRQATRRLQDPSPWTNLVAGGGGNSGNGGRDSGAPRTVFETERFIVKVPGGARGSIGLRADVLYHDLTGPKQRHFTGMKARELLRHVETMPEMRTETWLEQTISGTFAPLRPTKPPSDEPEEEAVNATPP